MSYATRQVDDRIGALVLVIILMIFLLAQKIFGGFQVVRCVVGKTSKASACPVFTVTNQRY